MRTTDFSKLALIGTLAAMTFNSSSRVLAFEEWSEVKESSFSWGSQIGNLIHSCDQKHLGGLEVSESRNKHSIRSLNKRYQDELARTQERTANLGILGIADLALFRIFLIENNNMIENPDCKSFIRSLSWPAPELPENAKNMPWLLSDWLLNGLTTAQIQVFCKAHHRQTISTQSAKDAIEGFITLTHDQKNSQDSEDAYTHFMLNGVLRLGEQVTDGANTCMRWMFDKLEELDKKV